MARLCLRTRAEIVIKPVGVAIISLQEIVRPDHGAPHMRRVRPVEPQPLLGLSKVTSDDPSNRSRALLLLQRQGLIKLMDLTNIFATAHDIVWNLKKVKIRELKALRSPEAKQFVQDTYHGAVLATF